MKIIMSKLTKSIRQLAVLLVALCACATASASEAIQAHPRLVRLTDIMAKKQHDADVLLPIFLMFVGAIVACVTVGMLVSAGRRQIEKQRRRRLQMKEV